MSVLTFEREFQISWLTKKFPLKVLRKATYTGDALVAIINSLMYHDL